MKLKTHLRMAEHQLSLMAPNTKSFYFTAQSWSGAPDPKLFSGTLAECWPSISEQTQNGKFMGVFLGGTPNIQSIIMGSPIKAFSIYGDYEDISSFPLKPHLVMQLGPSRWEHIFLTVLGLPSEFQVFHQRLSKYYDCNSSEISLAQMFMIAGTYTYQQDPFLIRIVHESGLPRYTWDVVKTAFLPDCEESVSMVH